MHPNRLLLHNLFTSLNRHDHESMAECYHSSATFRDIAFTLSGKRHIHAMWHMICQGDIRAAFDVIDADDRAGRVSVIDEYTFSDTGRPVRNVIESRFRFADGVIVAQRDYCDARAWARMAIGGIKGFLAGRSHRLRSKKAHGKLRAFIRQHPEYR